MKIQIIIEGGTAAEVQEAVNDLSACFVVGADGTLSQGHKIEKTRKTSAQAALPASTPAVETPVNTDNTSTGGSAPAHDISIELLRKELGTRKEKNEQIIELFQLFGVTKLTALKTEDYPEFLKKLQAL